MHLQSIIQRAFREGTEHVKSIHYAQGLYNYSLQLGLHESAIINTTCLQSLRVGGVCPIHKQSVEFQIHRQMYKMIWGGSCTHWHGHGSNLMGHCLFLAEQHLEAGLLLGHSDCPLSTVVPHLSELAIIQTGHRASKNMWRRCCICIVLIHHWLFLLSNGVIYLNGLWAADCHWCSDQQGLLYLGMSVATVYHANYICMHGLITQSANDHNTIKHILFLAAILQPKTLHITSPTVSSFDIIFFHFWHSAYSCKFKAPSLPQMLVGIKNQQE